MIIQSKSPFSLIFPKMSSLVPPAFRIFLNFLLPWTHQDRRDSKLFVLIEYEHLCCLNGRNGVQIWTELTETEETAIRFYDFI